jgi:hypothetical protein
MDNRNVRQDKIKKSMPAQLRTTGRKRAFIKAISAGAKDKVC